MQLGRVSGLLWSIKRLRKQLVDAEGAFILNAASLNPDVYHLESHYISIVKGREYDQLPDGLQELASRLQNFRDRLDEFHERTVVPITPYLEGTLLINGQDEAAALHQYLNVFIRNVKVTAASS